jgi:mannosyl-oligosaccharide glucosidase
MTDIAKIIGKDQEADIYESTAEFLSDNSLLDNTHWSVQHGAYLDYGLHSEDVVLQRPRPPPGSNQQMPKQRVVVQEPKYQYVNQVGYVSKYNMMNAPVPSITEFKSNIRHSQYLDG